MQPASPLPLPPPSAGKPTPRPGGSASPQASALTIVYNDGAGTPTTWRLTCDPAGGDHPDPEAACRALATAGDMALPSVPKTRACTQVYGGPETATISGTWDGKPVSSRLSRQNGCEIARWKALAGLLPPGGQ